MRVFPLFVDNRECNVFIWRSCYEHYRRYVRIIFVFNDFVGRCLGFVYEIRVEDVELVSLNNFRRWVVLIVVCLVVSR